MSEHKVKLQRKMIRQAVAKERITIETEIKNFINAAPFTQRIKFAGLVLVGKV